MNTSIREVHDIFISEWGIDISYHDFVQKVMLALDDMTLGTSAYAEGICKVENCEVELPNNVLEILNVYAPYRVQSVSQADIGIDFYRSTEESRLSRAYEAPLGKLIYSTKSGDQSNKYFFQQGNYQPITYEHTGSTLSVPSGIEYIFVKMLVQHLDKDNEITINKTHMQAIIHYILYTIANRIFFVTPNQVNKARLDHFRQQKMHYMRKARFDSYVDAIDDNLINDVKDIMTDLAKNGWLNRPI